MDEVSVKTSAEYPGKYPGAPLSAIADASAEADNLLDHGDSPSSSLNQSFLSRRYFKFLLIICVFVNALLLFQLISYNSGPGNKFVTEKIVEPSQAKETEPGSERIPEVQLLTNSKFTQLQHMALVEVNLPQIHTFKYPQLPIQGYRDCLNRPKVDDPVRVSLGAVTECPDCTPLNVSSSFLDLSKAVCKSQQLYCGTGATELCGLLGIYLKKLGSVAATELKTWPAYMQDFEFQNASVTPILEKNHRLLFDRHTIMTSHPLLRQRYAHYNATGFNVLEFASNDLKLNTPTKSGNMGDIFGSYVAQLFISRIRQKHLDSASMCPPKTGTKLDQKKFNLSLTLVGSTAHWVANVSDNILLGVGSIASDALTRWGPKTLPSSSYVLGVRGTKTRDDFIKIYGVNPEVVTDPGLYVYDVFREVVQEVRNSTMLKEICFIAHYVDVETFQELFPQYHNITTSASGKIETIIRFLAGCKRVVSSTLHGVIFSHSLGIPVLPIKVHSKEPLWGGEWKFYDHFYGINVTTFTGRTPIEAKTMPVSLTGWIKMVDQFPQPTFPITGLKTFDLFKSIFIKEQ